MYRLMHNEVAQRNSILQNTPSNVQASSGVALDTVRKGHFCSCA